MYALAVSISRDEDAVQTCHQRLNGWTKETYLVGDPGRILASLVRRWEKRIVLMSEILAQVLFHQ